MRKTIVVTALAASLSLGATGCSTFFEKVLPVVAKVITTVQDAEQILNKLDRAAQLYFAASPDPEQQAKFERAMGKARSALNAATRAANGMEKLDQQAIDTAFADFKVAYQEVLNVLGPLGVARQQGDQVLLSASGETLTVPPPLALEAK